jgi:hypothetical protein
MEFQVTTYRSQALMNHLPLPSVLVDLIKNFVFFDTSTFYRIMEEPMLNKTRIGDLIRTGHSRCNNTEFYDIQTRQEPQRWSFSIDNRFLTRYMHIHARRGLQITAVNCEFCGNYLSNAETIAPVTRTAPRRSIIFCKCKFVDGYNEREFPEYRYNASVILSTDRDQSTEVSVEINYGPTIMPPARKSKYQQQKQQQQNTKSGL